MSGELPEPLARSRFAIRLLGARPELAAELHADAPLRRAAMAEALAGSGADGEAALKRRLRRLRQRVLFRTMARDLAGAADLAEVCGAMSDLAEQTIACALGWAQAQLAAEFGAPRGADGRELPLLVIGMGKLGGRELNVSSDIDLVFIYPSEGETGGERSISHHEYFTRLGKRLIALLGDVTEDGFVFRVDMRLRPYGESGPIAASLDALEAYFVAQGREWERYAWIKARAVTGDGAAREALAAVVRPFVFRKYLDYATLAAMRRLHGEVRREVARRELAEHVKLGPGGIREIEFVVQALQLVRGGREPALAVRPTLLALARLAERRLLPEAAARALGESYVFLRNIEHRLQYLDDAQTHLLPENAGDQARLAAMADFPDWATLAAKLDALEAYFVAQGREWERYAWIKARPVSGSRHEELAAIVRPFVYRKYLDYGTLEAMRRLHAEVRRDMARRELAEHIKLGPGGIREIEFIAQALQLVRGGRDAELTVRPTLAVLELLAKKRHLPERARQDLSVAYVFLRNVEHRLQYLDDAQTHELPADEDDRARVAHMAGYASWDAFVAVLNAHREAVTHHFQSVFAERGAEGDAKPWPEHPRLVALRASQRYTQLPEDSKRRFDALIPALASAAAATADPEASLARGVDLLEAIARRAAYLALLAERPEALERVTRMIGASSWAAQYVTQHPLLLDELLDDRVLYSPPDWREFELGLRGALAAAAGDVERQMNAVREQHQSQLFRLLAQDLAGLLTVEVLADHLSQLADIVLQVSLEAAWAQLASRHRQQPRFAVIAYGKLGGKELGYASDLDLVFLFEDAEERAEENYLRLAQRYNNWLSANTSSGPLFETDLALRPSGSKGLLVSSLSGFDEYQEHSAWIWEHQALTRARFCAGDAAVGAGFEAIRTHVLTAPRDPAALAQEVRAMRQRLHEAHPNPSRLFDVKHDRGGMIDLEFIVQFLVLAHAHRHAALTANLGNIALLKTAGELGLVAPARAEQGRTAYREFRRVQHALRLSGTQYARVPLESVAPHATAVRALWSEVLG